MIIEIIASLFIFTGIYANICVVLLANAAATGDWVKEMIVSFYTDFNDSAAWVMLILNLGMVVSVIYFIFR